MTNPYAPVPFQFDLGSKAIAVESESGDLIIRGIGANFAWDKQGERFLQGSFTRSLKKFLAGTAPLLWHHKWDSPIGKITGAKAVANGIEIEAVVHYQQPDSPLRYAYDAIRRKAAQSLSVGGLFSRRVDSEGRPEIVDVEILEWSACPVPVGNGTTFEILATKALRAPEGKALTSSGALIDSGDDLAALQREVRRLETAAQDLRTQRLHARMRHQAMRHDRTQRLARDY